MRRGGGKGWQEGGGDTGVLELLLHHGSQLLGNSVHIDGFDGSRASINDDPGLAFMGNEDGMERLGVSIHKEAELGENGEPDIVGAQPEVQVLLPGAYDGVREAVLVGYHGAVFSIWNLKTERRAKDGGCAKDGGGFVVPE